MAQSQISFFVDDASVTALDARVPDAEVNSGMFAGASNSPGIGISTENPGLGESLPNWTLLDQFGNARVNQRSQCIGGPGISSPSESDGQEGTLPAAVATFIDVDALPTNAEKADGTYLDGQIPALAPTPGCALNSLATGWEAGV